MRKRSSTSDRQHHLRVNQRLSTTEIPLARIIALSVFHGSLQCVHSIILARAALIFRRETNKKLRHRCGARIHAVALWQCADPQCSRARFLFSLSLRAKMLSASWSNEWKEGIVEKLALALRIYTVGSCCFWKCSPGRGESIKSSYSRSGFCIGTCVNFNEI